MKKHIHYTRGEWVAALVLLALILFSYLFYYLYDTNKKPALDFAYYEAVFDDFNRRQLEICDSLEMVGGRRHAVEDTSRKFINSKKTPMYEIVKIDINHCDTNDIVVIPQFGSKRAARLVEYRDRLGGFYSLHQIREIYVLQDMDMALIEKYFYLRPSDVQRININTASYKEMVAHPYIDAYLTKLIINYREKSGKITSFEQLQNITHAYPELMEKLKHYVDF